MDKVIVVYWSQTGNTAAMAEAVGQGITEAGKEAVICDVSSASIEELKAAKQLDANSRVYYLNLPERFVAGEVYDEEADEVLIGATVKLFKGDELVAQTTTDDFGDFWFKDVKPASYVVKFEQDGYLAGETAADANEVDVNVGSIALYTA